MLWKTRSHWHSTIRASQLLGENIMQKRIETFFVSNSSKRAKVTLEASKSSSSLVLSAKEFSSAENDADAKKNGDQIPRDTKEEQIRSLQEMRIRGNRNNALAKQAVIKSEQAGDLPRISDLLIEESWKIILKDEFSKSYFEKLEKYVRSEWNSHMVFPPKDAIFRAFNSCPVDNVRVVILGQDPYHDLGQAQGLSFSVPKGKQLPSSLRNIYKELNQDLGCPIGIHGCLEKWAHQGVLLLNAVLTVRAHNAASHAKQGWETFTSEAIARLSKEKKGIVFMLWGKYAQEKGKVIDRKNGHHILTSAHPSGLSAHRGFFGCHHFSECNKILSRQGDLPIDWCINE